MVICLEAGIFVFLVPSEKKMKRKNILKALALGDCKMSKVKNNKSKYPWKYTPFFREGMPEELDCLSILVFGSVLMRTLNYENKNCSVSVGNLASELKISRKTVYLRLKILLDLGMIEKIGWSNAGTNKYVAIIDRTKWKSTDTISQKDIGGMSEKHIPKSERPMGYVTVTRGVGQSDLQEEVIEESTEEQLKESIEESSNKLISKDSIPVNNLSTKEEYPVFINLLANEDESPVSSPHVSDTSNMGVPTGTYVATQTETSDVDNLVFVDISKDKVIEDYGDKYPVFEKDKVCPRCGRLESTFKNNILQCGHCGYPVNTGYTGLVNAAFVRLSD
jgi:ribosomal protein S27AE